MVKAFDDLIEPDTDDEKKFNLSIKQLQFIQNDDNVKFINNIMKIMKKYKLEVEDINNIIQRHIINEEKQDRNEARRLKKQQEKNNDNDEDLKSDKRSLKRSKKKEVIKKDNYYNTVRLMSFW